MAERSSQTHLAAAFQLLASYLFWDLQDLLQAGILEGPDSRSRLGQLIDMLDNATRAMQLSYPAKPPQAGTARGERTERLATLNSDQQLLELISVAHEDKDLGETSQWAGQVSSMLKDVRESDWQRPDEEAAELIEKDLQPFLRRLQRIDQLEPRRPGGALGRR